MKRSGPQGDKGVAMAAERVVAYRRAAARPPAQAQIERMMADLTNLSVLSSRQDLVGARGAALALAHTALTLAVTPLSDAGERHRRADILRGTVVPALRPAGLGHVGVLFEAALAHDGDPAGVADIVRTKQ